MGVQKESKNNNIFSGAQSTSNTIAVMKDYVAPQSKESNPIKFNATAPSFKPMDFPSLGGNSSKTKTNNEVSSVWGKKS